jgi:hypothetical protein
MTTPQPYDGSQQQQPPQQYPQQQYQQPPQQQSTYPTQQYGAQQPPKKSKMPMMIGIIVAVIVIIVVLLLLFLVILKPSTSAMTATQIMDDYELMEFNYKSFNDGDTITLRDEILEIDDYGSSTWLTFEYTGSDSMYQWSDFEVVVSGSIGDCQVGDTITLKATVDSLLGLEIGPEGLNWSVSDTSSCTA